MRLDNLFVLCLIFLSLAGCGYRWHGDYPGNAQPTICVPTINKDEEVDLTSEIIATLNQSGIARVVSQNADYRMSVEIVSLDREKIGFRRDSQLIRGKLVSNLVSSEERGTLSAKVTLYHNHSEKIAYGPYFLTADSEYDFVDGDSYEDLTFTPKNQSRKEVSSFSLGQLESIEAAREAASKPLHRALAQKIVDAICAEW